MCGRTACTLTRNQIQRACSRYNAKSNKYEQPAWEEAEDQNGGRSYKPSHNVCPTDVTPVLIAKGQDRLLTPMMWGMIPPWHKGNCNDHRLSTNNCRIETILESRLYKTPMVTGHRCVVMCDGFYEWQTTKGEKDKQPYFIYAPQNEGLKIDDTDSWVDDWSESAGWSGPKLLYMAGLYNIWTSQQGEKFWSYSVVTMESDSLFGWLHHRVPAILDSESAVDEWLSGKEDSSALLTRLTPNRPLAWHPVSSKVNNSRDKSVGLNRAVEISTKKRLSKSAAFLDDWLKGSKRKRDDDESTPSKRDKNDSMGTS